MQSAYDPSHKDYTADSTHEPRPMIVTERVAERLPMSSLQIRRMRAGDVQGIMAIESVSFGRHHWSEDSFLNEMKNTLGRYFTLVHSSSSQQGKQEHIIGYCGYWLLMDEAHITTVAVQPALRGQSLGELLLVHMLDRCMGQTVHWVTLEVRVSNNAAQNLYYKYGFNSMGVRPKYYQDNQEDALIMTTPDILTDSYRTLFRQCRESLTTRLSHMPQGFGE